MAPDAFDLDTGCSYSKIRGDAIESIVVQKSHEGHGTPTTGAIHIPEPVQLWKEMWNPCVSPNLSSNLHAQLPCSYSGTMLRHTSSKINDSGKARACVTSQAPWLYSGMKTVPRVRRLSDQQLPICGYYVPSSLVRNSPTRGLKRLMTS